MAINLYLMIMIDENAIDLKKAYLAIKSAANISYLCQELEE